MNNYWASGTLEPCSILLPNYQIASTIAKPTRAIFHPKTVRFLAEYQSIHFVQFLPVTFEHTPIHAQDLVPWYELTNLKCESIDPWENKFRHKLDDHQEA